MNEVAALRAIKELIVENNDSLARGLTYQGEPLVIKQITTSGHTPIVGYPFISVLSSDDRETYEYANTSTGKRYVEYSVVIGIAGHVFVQVGDDEPYEISDNYHKTLCDRVVDLIAEQTSLTDEESGAKFRLEKEHGINRSNGGLTKRDEAGNYHSLLFTDITFTLQQRC